MTALIVAWGIGMGCLLVNPGRFMVDDAWFYLQIGRNIGLGLGSTFDGETPTNGYHPLWQGIVALLSLISTERSTLHLATLAFQIPLATAALWLLYRAARAFQLPWPILLPVVAAIVQFGDQVWLSEGPVSIFFHAGLLYAAATQRGPVVMGVLAGLLLLARLDTAFFVLAFVGVQRTWPERLQYAVVAGLVVAPWAGWTLMSTGHLVPVSGAIKSTFPIPAPTHLWNKVGVVGAGAAIGSVVTAIFALRGDRRPWTGPALALSVGGLTHLIYTALFTAPFWSTSVAYYWITTTLATGIGAALLLDRYLGLLPSFDAHRPLIIGGVALTLTTGVTGRAVRAAFAPPDPVVELSYWIADIAPDARILTLDAPGRMAWFSGRPVIAMDGLTRSYGFSDDLRAMGFERWAREQRLTHLVSYDQPADLPWCQVQRTPDQVEITFRSPDDRQPVGSGTLDRRDALRHLNDTPKNPASVYSFDALRTQSR